jgi:DNA (cytosine-5)-methyltransferase 1
MHASVFSFFAGAGFLDLGFEHSGFEIALVNEFNQEFARGYEFAHQRLKCPLPRHGIQITSIESFTEGKPARLLSSLIAEERRAGRLVGFVGGPPCPDFSVGGKNRGAQGDNGRLTEVYFQLIAKFRPDWFLFENVKGLFRTHRHRQFFEAMKETVKRSGYSTSERLINAIEYGVAQDRDRIILVGLRSSKQSSDGVAPMPWMASTVFPRGVLTELPWPEATPFGLESVKRHRDIPVQLTVQHWFNLNRVDHHPNARHCFQPRQGLARFKSVEEGDDSRKSFKRLHRFRYSPTACYGNNEVHLHPTKARRISVAEALAIQSLPAEYELPADMSLSAMFKTVGNGVPYLAAKGLAVSVKQMLAEDR